MGPFSRVLLSLKSPPPSVVRYLRDFCENHESEFKEVASENSGNENNNNTRMQRKHWREYDDYELAYMALFYQGALSAYLLAAQNGYEGLPKM